MQEGTFSLIQLGPLQLYQHKQKYQFHKNEVYIYGKILNEITFKTKYIELITQQCIGPGRILQQHKIAVTSPFWMHQAMDQYHPKAGQCYRRWDNCLEKTEYLALAHCLSSLLDFKAPHSQGSINAVSIVYPPQELVLWNLLQPSFIYMLHLYSLANLDKSKFFLYKLNQIFIFQWVYLDYMDIFKVIFQDIIIIFCDHNN